MSTVADKFVKNIKVLADQRSLSDSDTKLILLTIQEMVTISTVEVLSLLDNLDILMEQSKVEMPVEEFEALKVELLEG